MPRYYKNATKIRIFNEIRHLNPFFFISNRINIELEREDIFKPFLEIRDLTTGDGLGLPICKQMALKMKGDLDIDPAFTKGTRFVLDLHV